MDDIGQRIDTLIQTLNVRKSAFATRINVTPSLITRIVQGKTMPSDRTIIDICREFRVNEQWLRTGEGDMFRPIARDQEIAAFAGDLLRST